MPAKTPEPAAPPRYRLSQDGTVFSTRARAEEIRANVESLVRGRPAVVLDFDGVRSISFSFADELFGVLAERHQDDASCPQPIAIGLAAQAQRVLLGSLSQRGIPDAKVQQLVPH